MPPDCSCHNPIKAVVAMVLERSPGPKPDYAGLRSGIVAGSCGLAGLSTGWHSTWLMAKTNHYGARVSQRGIRQATVDLALKHGVRHGEKYVLGKKQIKHLMGEFDQIRKNLCVAMDKGGVVVVASDGVLITAYDFDSHRTY